VHHRRDDIGFGAYPLQRQGLLMGIIWTSHHRFVAGTWTAESKEGYFDAIVSAV